MSYYHTPVLLDEVISGLHIEKGKRYIDATLGGGGHAWEIVKRGGILLGIDADWDAVGYVREEFKRNESESGTRGEWTIIQGNFRDIAEIAQTNGFNEVAGVLFDLGVSSRQLDSADKGFTYRIGTGRLDMRFDQQAGEPADMYVNRVSEEELYEVFSKYGEEERARTIAHALIRARSIKPLKTAGDVNKVVSDIIGNEHASNATLSRIFQAIRIAVNDELGAIQDGLVGSHDVLATNGRLAVISFHSLEDRIVKQEMRKDYWKEVTKKPIRASYDEVKHNGRSRSAKLRIAEKL
ncbi:MAG TPA: 16S rRNA (cytosine(1402)-N(4))-methyltransferase RsmH [Patescibacteria group bacterium]|nr:16S rRNA (cytosine(1402)-N(4))-methyltransferase RsmH [Patescibacteria group bacterium]